jgi:hypothetical protein
LAGMSTHSSLREIVENAAISSAGELPFLEEEVS